MGFFFPFQMVELLAFIGIVVVLFWLLRGGVRRDSDYREVRRDSDYREAGAARLDAVRPLDAYYDPTREEYIRNLPELLEDK